MANKIDFSRIVPLLEAGEDFSMTEKQYQKKTGKQLPKDTNYLKNKSALSRAAREHGYSVEVNERTITLKKIV